MLFIFIILCIGIQLTSTQQINGHFALITSEYYPNGQICHFGRDSMRAIELAAKRNALTFDVFVSNGKALIKSDEERLRKYIDTHRISAIIEGGGWSNVTLDLLETFQKVPLIGFASAAQLKSKEKFPNYFSLSYTDDIAASSLISLAVAMKWKTISVMGNPVNPFGMGGLIGINQSISRIRPIERRPRIVSYIPFSENADQDELVRVVTKASMPNPDGYLISSPGPLTRSILNVAAQVNIAPGNISTSPTRWLATEKVEITSSDNITQSGAQHYVSYDSVAVPCSSRETNEYLRTFEDTYGYTPDPWASRAYGTVLVLKDALRYSKTTSSLMSSLRHNVSVWTPSGLVEYHNSNSNTGLKETLLDLFQYKGSSFKRIGTWFSSSDANDKASLLLSPSFYD